MTFFGQVVQKYPYQQGESGGNEGIDASLFLAATRESLGILDKLGIAFRLVKSDIMGNITTLQTRHDSDPVKFSTLKAMIVDEADNGHGDDYYSATQALLWLKRALEFFCTFTSLLVSEYRKGTLGDSLTLVISTAYEQSLRKHHNWFMRTTFFFVARAMPSRHSYFKSVANGQENVDDLVIEDMDKFVQLLAPNLEVINQIFAELGRPD